MNVFAFNASVMYNLGEILLSLSVNDCPLSVKCSETPAVAGFVNHREKMGELGKEAGTAAWTRGKGVGQTPPAGRAGQRCFQRQVSTPRPGTLAAGDAHTARPSALASTTLLTSPPGCSCRVTLSNVHSAGKTEQAGVRNEDHRWGQEGPHPRGLE